VGVTAKIVDNPQITEEQAIKVVDWVIRYGTGVDC
jgi:hypothetical protein